MRLWISAIVLVGAGGLLVWLGARQLDDAWPRSVRTISGHVADVDARVIAGAWGREPRFGIRLENLGARFEVETQILPRPTAAALMDAATVSIEYDGQVRVRPNPTGQTQYEPYYVVTGLTVDGRVFFATSTYRVMTVLWALLAGVPGVIMLGVGATWLYRLFRFGHIYRLQGRLLFSTSFARGRRLTASSEPPRDRRKTSDGQWLH
jgi:hypothetical protein